MMAGIEIDKYASGHQIQIFPNTNVDRLGKTGRYLQECSFFALHDFYSGPF